MHLRVLLKKKKKRLSAPFSLRFDWLSLFVLVLLFVEMKKNEKNEQCKREAQRLLTRFWPESVRW